MTSKAKSNGSETIEAAVAAGKQTVEEVMRTSTRNYEQAVSTTKEQVEKASAAMLRGYDDLATFNKQNVDAFVQAGNIWAKGAEELGKAYFSFAQASAEKNAEAAKSLLAAKSLKDVVDVQADYARTSFDTLVAEGTRINEMTIKIGRASCRERVCQYV